MIETLVFALVLNMVMFLIAFRNKTDKLTDISYAVTFVGIALFGAVRNEMSSAQWLVFALVCVWAARLGSYLLIRINAMGRDKRFDEMRSSFWKFGRFWLLQGLTAWIVMLPATFLFQSAAVTEINTVVIIGTIVSIAGLLIEGFADQQKFRFIQDKQNKGKWIENGLWKYSRHPNYFGEILMWYGVYIASYTWLSDRNMYLALAGPLFITFMLVGVSGIPLLEASADKRWGSDKKYQAYKRRTSVLLLLPNKKG